MVHNNWEIHLNGNLGRILGSLIRKVGWLNSEIQDGK